MAGCPEPELSRERMLGSIGLACPVDITVRTPRFGATGEDRIASNTIVRSKRIRSPVGVRITCIYPRPWNAPTLWCRLVKAYTALSSLRRDGRACIQRIERAGRFYNVPQKGDDRDSAARDARRPILKRPLARIIHV